MLSLTQCGGRTVQVSSKVFKRLKERLALHEGHAITELLPWI